MDRFWFRAKSQAGYWLYGGFDDGHIVTCDGMAYDIISETIGQCTGLKDKNAEFFWEGDIYTYTTYRGIKRFIVKYEPCFAGYFGYKIGGDGNTRQNIMPFNEIIGNIHENPELLRKTQ